MVVHTHKKFENPWANSTITVAQMCVRVQLCKLGTGEKMSGTR